MASLVPTDTGTTATPESTGAASADPIDTIASGGGEDVQIDPGAKDVQTSLDGIDTDGADEYVKTAMNGKYNNVRDLVDGYKELRKSKGQDEPPPEHYEMSEEALTEAGLSAIPESDPFYASIQTTLKEGGFKQSQIPFLLKLAAERDQYNARQNGPIKDPAAEYAILEKEWGKRYQGRGAEIAAWADKNLHPDIWQSLGKSAEGMKFLDGLYRKAERGPTPITNKAPARVSTDDINLKIQTIMSNPEYSKNTEAGRALNAQVDRLFMALDKANTKR